MARFILERNRDYGTYHLFGHDPKGRSYLLNFCKGIFERVFPHLGKLPRGHSVEVEITIKTVGESAPWKGWVWVEE